MHVAAQAGIGCADRWATVRDNVLGLVEVLEFCSQRPVAHLVHASTGAVYGANTELPYKENHRTDDPLSVYAATKRSGELLSRCWSALHDLPVTSLRFFTIYGPWGRPDMAAWLFSDAILEGRPIQVHGHGRMRRSFTYVDDLVAGILAAAARIPVADEPGFRHAVYNLGDPESINLNQFVSILESTLGKKALCKFVGSAPGEMEMTAADIEAAQETLGFQVRVPIQEGLRRFSDWFLHYRDSNALS